MRELTMENGRVTDADPKLRCTRCEPRGVENVGDPNDEEHRELPALTDYERESENVVRCTECGKRHSNDSLVDANALKITE